MKLSKTTIDILRNFSSINQGIHFNVGNVIRSAHPNREIIGRATLEDQIPENFVIYDLNSFLGIVSLRQDPEFHFVAKDKLVIQEGGIKVNYTLAEPSTVNTCPDPSEMDSPDVKFTLTQAQLDDLKKNASILRLEDLKVEGDKETVRVVVYDAKDPKCNVYALDTGVPTTHKFSFVFKVENLRFISSTYNVSIKREYAGHFRSTQHKVEYWLPLQKGSKFVE